MNQDDKRPAARASPQETKDDSQLHTNLLSIIQRITELSLFSTYHCYLHTGPERPESISRFTEHSGFSFPIIQEIASPLGLRLVAALHFYKIECSGAAGQSTYAGARLHK